MKPKLYSCLAIVLFAAIFVISCKKGDTGPAGPAGPAGAAGTAGAAGPKGDSGTANVVYSAWTDVTYAPITDDTTNPGTIDTLAWAAAISAPKLTSDILNKGEIKVYFNFGSTANPDIIPLPFIDFISTGWNIQVDLAVGNIYLTANDNFSSGTSGGVKLGQYRYILIPGSVPASVNVKDYNAVRNYFNLPN
ncbi:MAG TPA: hypothetical protein VGN00_24265 [Puia sp.]|jgi:hypothetical protein